MSVMSKRDFSRDTDGVIRLEIITANFWSEIRFLNITEFTCLGLRFANSVAARAKGGRTRTEKMAIGATKQYQITWKTSAHLLCAPIRRIYRGGRRHHADMSVVVPITLSCRVLPGHKVTWYISTTDIVAGTPARPKALVCGRSISDIVGLNPGRDLMCVCCVGKCLCDGSSFPQSACVT